MIPGSNLDLRKSKSLENPIGKGRFDEEDESFASSFFFVDHLTILIRQLAEEEDV